MPAMNNMLSKWIPVSERSRALALVYSGMYLGSVTGLAISPALIQNFGWASVFYSFGSLGSIWFALWLSKVRFAFFSYSPMENERCPPPPKKKKNRKRKREKKKRNMIFCFRLQDIIELVQVEFHMSFHCMLTLLSLFLFVFVFLARHIAHQKKIQHLVRRRKGLYWAEAFQRNLFQSFLGN